MDKIASLSYIALDFDGVLCRPPFGINLGIGHGDWTYNQIFGRKRQGDSKMRDLLTKLRYASRRPLDDARAGLVALSNVRRVAIITGRPGALKTDLIQWLKRYQLAEFVQDVFANDSGLSIPRFKLEMARELGAEAFVEDDGRTARFLFENGFPLIFLRDWPKNRGKYPVGIWSVHTLPEVATILQASF